VVSPILGLMGNKPEIIIAPSSLAELSQNTARINSLFTNSGFTNYIAKEQKKIEAFVNDYKQKLEPIIEAGNRIKSKLIAAFNQIKSWFKKPFVLPIKFVLKPFEIFIAYIEPSSGKALPLPNSYRSTSPPLSSLIK
jgi:hypothetical protein